MNYLYPIIKADYLQRSRSYAFLITLAVTIYAAWSFVPPPEANYTTLNLDSYKGVYNSAWVGHVTALMSTLILSLCGFFLVIGGIKKDVDTEVGLIIATTPISNFGYLLSKLFSNFLILLTISGLAFLVGILMFFIRSSGYPFHISDFLLPYLVMVVPAMFLISGMAILAEVFLGRKSVIQYLLFFFLFGVLMSNVNNNTKNPMVTVVDGLGIRTVFNSVKEKVNAEFNESIKTVSLGYLIHKNKTFKSFVWEGVSWSGLFLLSRALWISLMFGLVYLSSFFFHRFDFKQAVKKEKKNTQEDFLKQTAATYTGFQRSALPPIIADYGIIPFIKTELLLMVRKDSKWLWITNIGLWVATLFVPLQVAYSFLLPVLLFMQVGRISELTTKEKTNRVHYFSYASYKPLQRMLPAQIIAAFFLLIVLALPVIGRLLMASNLMAMLQVMNGSLLIVLLSVCLGILTGSKKLFEILFFALTYIVFQGIPEAHYLGAIAFENYGGMVVIILMINIFLLICSFAIRNYQTRNL